MTMKRGHIKRGKDCIFSSIICSQVSLSELPPPAVASPASGRPPVARARRATIQNTPQPKIPPNSEYSPTPKSTQFRKLPNSEYSPIQNTPKFRILPNSEYSPNQKSTQFVRVKQVEAWIFLFLLT